MYLHKIILKKSFSKFSYSTHEIIDDKFFVDQTLLIVISKKRVMIKKRKLTQNSC